VGRAAASEWTKGFCRRHQWHQAPSRGRYRTAIFYALYRQTSDDQGLIELLSHSGLLSRRDQHSKNPPILLDHGLSSRYPSKKLALSSDRQNSLQLAPKPAKAKKQHRVKQEVCSVATRWIIDGQILEWSSRAIKNFEAYPESCHCKGESCFVH